MRYFPPSMVNSNSLMTKWLMTKWLNQRYSRCFFFGNIWLLRDFFVPLQWLMKGVGSSHWQQKNCEVKSRIARIYGSIVFLKKNPRPWWARIIISDEPHAGAMSVTNGWAPSYPKRLLCRESWSSCPARRPSGRRPRPAPDLEPQQPRCQPSASCQARR